MSQQFFHRFLDNQKCLQQCGAPQSGAIWGPVGLLIPWISRSFWSIWRGTLPLNWCRPVGVFKRTQSILEHGLICDDDGRIRGLKTLKHWGKTGRPCQQSHLQPAEVKAELFIHIKGSMGMDGMTQESPRKMHAPAGDSKRIVSCLQSGLISLI